MIDVDEAQRVVLAWARPGPVVQVTLAEASYRTLAEPVRCDTDSPPLDCSVRDGYAVRADDVAKVPVALRIVGQIAAGCMTDKVLAPGEAMQINTGAPIPTGADAVLRLEDTEWMESRRAVLIHTTAESGQFIARRGTYASAGQTVLDKGALLTPLEIGAAAAAGASVLKVYERPSVAVLATGDELIEVERTPTGGQIRNSNQYMLEALIRAAQANPVVLDVARDDRDALRERIVEGLRCNVLCVTGGVSMGAFDFVPEVLTACGTTLRIRGLAIKPGRPTVFGTAPDGTLVFGLPGNPVSAFVGFELLARPALAALQGRAEAVRREVRARLCGSVQATRDRRSFALARARVDADGGFEVEPLSWRGFGDCFGMVTANALIVRGPHEAAASAPEAVSIILLDRI